MHIESAENCLIQGVVINNLLSRNGGMKIRANFHFAVLLSESRPGPYALVNEAWVADGIGIPQPLRALVLVDPRQYYLPVFVRP